MAKVLVAYASLTGNTEEIAELIVEGIRAAGGEAVLKSVMDCNADEIKAYEAVMLGAYTWETASCRMNSWISMKSWMSWISAPVRRRPSEAETPGMRSTAEQWIRLKKLKERGAEIVQPSLKIEYGPNAAEKEACRTYGRQFIEICAAVS